MCSQNLPVEEKKGRSALFWICVGIGSFSFLGVIAFVIMVVVSFAFLGGSVSPESDSSGKEVLREIHVSGSGENKIVLVPIKGVISDKSAGTFLMNSPSLVHVVKRSLEQAASDNSVKGVILEVDSPGGGITASDVIYNYIVNFKNKTGKTVVVYMQDVAASGGYYVSVAADKIIAHPTTITGSIGVIMPIVNIAKLVEKYGIENGSIKSGMMKDIGSPLKEMSSEEKEVLTGIIDEMYLRFVTIISNGRDLSIDEVKRLADGRIYTGNQAVENGLIDQVGYIEDAIVATGNLAGLQEAEVIRYEKRFSVGDFFKVIMSRISSQPEVKISIDSLPFKLLSRPMYLWMGS